MNNDAELATLLDYLDGQLPETDRQAVEQRLATDAAFRQMLDDLRTMSRDMAEAPLAMPSPASEQRFMAFLEQEKKQKLPTPQPPTWWTNLHNGWLLAAAVVILLFSAMLGWLWQNNRQQARDMASLQQEIHQTQQMLVLAALEKPSASDRIRAVNVLQKAPADPRITAALIHTMRFDESPNVRTRAAHALANFADDPVVKTALIDALQNPNSPEVQIAIIDILVAVGEKKAVPTFQDMLRDKKLLEMVRNKAASGIEVLI